MAFLLVLSVTAAHAYVWPNAQLDELEHLRYDQAGYNAGPLTGVLTPCDAYSFGASAGRSNAADWIRTVRCPRFRRTAGLTSSRRTTTWRRTTRRTARAG